MSRYWSVFFIWYIGATQDAAPDEESESSKSSSKAGPGLFGDDDSDSDSDSDESSWVNIKGWWSNL